MLFSAVLLPLLTQPALAWNHTGTVWDRRLFDESGEGLEWFISDSLEDSLEEGYEIEVLEASWAHWVNDAPCGQLAVNFMGRRDGHNAGYTIDGQNTFYYDDPADEVGTGVLGQTLTIPSGDVAFSLSGDTYVYSMDSDIIFNNDIDWASVEDIETGCTREYSVEAVATHEIGHLWGMGHSCEEGEDCSELDERYATMYWSIGPCSTYQAQLKTDDIEAITSLYGPYASFNSDSERDGGAPLEVCFGLEMDEENADVSIDWNFGDGTTESIENPNPDQEICHTYTEAGQYSVSMNVTGTQSECGEWSFTQRERAYVTVCDTPRPANGMSGMFTHEPVEAETDSVGVRHLYAQMVNQVDTSVYGCIEKIQWDVFSGTELIDSISAWAPKIEFPEEGEYRVVLNVGAPGDLYAAEELMVTVEDKGAGGCATAPATGGFAGLLIGLAGLALRRRRD